MEQTVAESDHQPGDDRTLAGWTLLAWAFIVCRRRGTRKASAGGLAVGQSTVFVRWVKDFADDRNTRQPRALGSKGDKRWLRP